MPSPYPYDPSRPVINVADARLNRLLLRDPQRCASVSEYATACGIDTAQVIELLGPYLDDGTLALEFFGDEVFVHTAPAGRPAPPGRADVAPNLWELLRDRAGVEFAFALWRLVRSLERAGWRVETQPNRILFGLGPVTERPWLGVDVGNVVVPLLVFPAADQLTAGGGLLAQYDRAGCGAVGIVCDEGALDEMVTAVRRWTLSRRFPPAMSVLILEAPRYHPTLLTPADAAVRPVAVTRQLLDTLAWPEPPGPS